MTWVGLVICLLLSPTDCLRAQQSPEPGQQSPESGTPPPIAPIVPGLGMRVPGLPSQLFGPPLSTLKKSDAPAPPAALYPMFQLLGPMIPTASDPADPTMMGNLLRMQGELMIKMGEVMMKYGQMMLEKGK